MSNLRTVWAVIFCLRPSPMPCPNVLSFITPDQNSPQKTKYGLFPEQLSGTAFTVKRDHNQKVWFYKLRPSVISKQFVKSSLHPKIIPSYLNSPDLQVTPNQLRWRPIPDVKAGEKKNFVEGLISILGAGDPSMK